MEKMVLGLRATKRECQLATAGGDRRRKASRYRGGQSIVDEGQAAARACGGEGEGHNQWLLFLPLVALFPGPGDLSTEVKLGSHLI